MLPGFEVVQGGKTPHREKIIRSREISLEDDIWLLQMFWLFCCFQLGRELPLPNIGSASRK
jgi:hypothetical protein